MHHNPSSDFSPESQRLGRELRVYNLAISVGILHDFGDIFHVNSLCRVHCLDNHLNLSIAHSLSLIKVFTKLKVRNVDLLLCLSLLRSRLLRRHRKTRRLSEGQLAEWVAQAQAAQVLLEMLPTWLAK